MPKLYLTGLAGIKEKMTDLFVEGVTLCCRSQTVKLLKKWLNGAG